MALCSFAEFADQCGMFEVAEDFFLRTLEFDPKYSYALVRYGNFLCRRDVRFVGQMFLEKGGQAAGTDGTIDALTGKQVFFLLLFFLVFLASVLTLFLV